MLGKGRKPAFEMLEQRRVLSADISLVRYFDTWDGGTVRSTDAAGLAYHPESGHLYIADSEINEMPEYFAGDNIFEVSLRGDTLYREIASNNAEPTGITYSEFDGFFYVTNDDAKKIYRYDDRLDTPLLVIDPRDAVPDAADPEGITSDPATGALYVVDGRSGGMQVLVYDAALQFQHRFSIAEEMDDGEGIAFDPVSRNLFIVSDPDKAVFEYTVDGTFVKEYDISGISPSLVSPQGLVFAPTSDPSDDPNTLALYIADGMKDNYPDGRIFETVLSRPGTFEARVAASSDDAEERATGWITTTSSDLELVHDSSDQTVGLRFVDVDIPQGASITNAYLQFQVDEATSGETSLVIQGQSIDDAPTFTTTSGDLSTRARTSAAVDWSPPAWDTVGASGADQRTPDLTSILQEIVDRPAWAAGNALALLLTGTGKRVAESFDGMPGAAPLLRVEFASAELPPENQPPRVEAGPDQTVVLPDSGQLEGTATDDGFPGTLVTTWTMQDGPAAVAFEDAGDPQTTVTFSEPGTYVLRLEADDGDLATHDEVTFHVLAENVLSHTVDVRVGASADDAEEQASGSVSTTSSDLELVHDRSDQTVGTRFAGLDIPQGASILNAYIQFQVDEASGDEAFLVLQAEDVDDAPTFAATSGNLSSRARTSTSVVWTPPAWNTVGEAGEDQRTPDLAGLIQEVVNRPGWAPGNALAVLLSGTGKRVAEAYDGKSEAAPMLHVEYSTGAQPANQPPQVDAGADQAVVLPGGATLDGAASDDGLPDDTLATHWSQVSGPGTATFDDASDPQTTVTFSEPGPYVLRLVADDGELTSHDDLVIDVLEETVLTHAVEVRVASSSDDAEERENGWITTTSSDLELVYDKSNQTVGLRFVDLAVPAGAVVTNAYVQFEADETNDVDTSLLIRGENVGDAQTFTKTKGSISARERTAASVPWTPPAWDAVGEAGAGQRTPDLAAIIQEIIDRPDWAAGNALAMILTGTGERVAAAYDGSPSGAPLLRIEFTTGEAATNQPPEVEAGADQTVRGDEVVALGGAASDDGLPDGTLATQWTQTSGPGTATFGDASDPQSTVAFSEAGSYVLALTADDGELTASDDVTISVVEEDAEPQTIEVRVASSADDAEERANGWVTTTSSDLELVYDSSNQTVGVRFTALQIPPGASIVEAHVQFQADETNAEETSLVIAGQRIDDAPEFSSATGNLSSRDRTSSSVPWSPPAWDTRGEAGPDQRTPDLAEIVQEIVNRPGWEAGNALALLVTGTGERVAEAYDGETNAAPLLSIQFVTSGSEGETLQAASALSWDASLDTATAAESAPSGAEDASGERLTRSPKRAPLGGDRPRGPALHAAALWQAVPQGTAARAAERTHLAAVDDVFAELEQRWRQLEADLEPGSAADRATNVLR